MLRRVPGAEPPVSQLPARLGAELRARAGVAPGWLHRLTSTRVVLTGILVLAAILRLWHVDRVGLNSDEAVYAGQGASIAGRDDFEPLFPVFRAHPLLFQTVISVGYRLGGGATVARELAAVVGVATVYATFRLGRLLYGRTEGLIAALLLAVMTYHVVVTRQVLLDGPMTLWTTLTLLAMAGFAQRQRNRWLYATAALLGMAFLTKETSILLVGAVYMFFALAPEIRVMWGHLLGAGALLAAIMLQYPLVLHLAGGGQTGGHYLSWQLFRRPNHSWSFYGEVVPEALGLGVVLVAAAGLVLLRARRSWRETLLLSWIVVPALFFELWPVKGYSYLLLTAPAVAVLAGRALAQWAGAVRWDALRRVPRWSLVWVPTAAVALPLMVGSVNRITPSASATLLAGAGGMPGGREAGRWLAAHVPPGAQLMTIGPSMANVLAFYGHRRAFGLSVSPNPLTRNPSYVPLVNPDLAIREGRVQYAAWDAFSAQRSPFFERALMRYVERYRGRVVHEEAHTVRTASGRLSRQPLIVVYVLRG